MNLTDGLDGLAIGPVMIAAASFVGISYLVGNAVFADYLQIHFVPGTGELAVLCGAVIGAGLGFLWFNAPPASIFMGDTGSLALGGLLGSVAVATKHEIVLAIIGGLFVLEAVSVIVQVVSFKLTGKRVFRMAPIHHHFEQLGWTEPQIVIRFWIIAIVLALAGLGHAEAAMIPVTSFAGKKVALFGLGGSGLASAQALLAGGADVIAFDDSAASIEKARAAGIATADLRNDRLVEDRRAGARARRAAHPSGAALDGRAGAQRRRRGDRRHRAVLPRAAQARAGLAVRRHHRHQRQIDHHGADRIICCVSAGRVRRARRQYRHARSCRSSRRSADHAHVIECSSYQIDLAPSLDPRVGILLNVSEDHLDRHGTLEHYAAVKERLVAGVQPDGTAVIGVDDDWCAAAAERIARQGKHVVRISVRRPLPDGHLRRERRDHAAPPAARRSRSRSSTASARCAACTMRRTRPARPRRRSRSALTPAAIQKGLRSFPGLAHRMEQVGRKGAVLFVNDSKATNADSAAQALACFTDIFWIAGGKPKTGGITSLRRILPAHPQGLSDRRGGGATSPRTLDGKVPTRWPARSTARSSWRRATPQASGLKEPVVLLSPACASFDQYRNFEVRGDAFRELVLALPGHRADQVSRPRISSKSLA